MRFRWIWVGLGGAVVVACGGMTRSGSGSTGGAGGTEASANGGSAASGAGGFAASGGGGFAASGGSSPSGGTGGAPGGAGGSGGSAPAGCVSDNQPCQHDADCCGGTCANGACVPLNPSCKTAGNACTSSTECCSHLCRAGKCILHASYCIQTGDVCTRAEDCCSGICNVAPGKALGVCATATGGATICTDYVDGIVCNGCGQCCSHLCAPYAPTGVDICQPSSGCHIDGDTCRKDSDCCGGAGSGVPGDGNVICAIAPGQTVGVCRNPTGCSPEGGWCHVLNSACLWGERNYCCGIPGVVTAGVCKLDGLETPRCFGLGTTCRTEGESCADAIDCCNGARCVPDASGALRCGPPAPDGGVACVGINGNCTVDADCCHGLSCVRAVGAVGGECLATSPASSCALLGQPCKLPADCCNDGQGGLTCATSSGVTCDGTQPGCTCFVVVH